MKKTLALKLVAASVISTIGIPQMVHAQDLEEVVVTGIRASLERSEDVKRQSRQIVDAITAEDLGKFPDQNVAESLQRISGVAITRSRGGEGRFVTVRGLGQEFNTLTYNGRKLATENEGREFSFDVVASELISAAQVFKTPDASQGDGSIGGRVNIQTLRPLDTPGLKVAGSVGGIYDDLSENTNVKLSGIFSNTWANDTIGFVGSVSYSERDIRTDVAESIQVNEGDINGDGILETVNAFTVGISEEQRERLGVTGALQFQINDVTRLTFDTLYTSFESPSVGSSYSFFPNASDIITNPVINSSNQVISQTTNADPANPFSNIFDIVARETQSDTETIQFGINLEGQFNDSFRYKSDFSYSNADGIRDNTGSADGSGSFFVVSFPGFNFTQTFTGDEVPDATLTTLNGVNTTQQVGIDQLTADAARLHFSRETSNEVEDEILAFRTDFEYDWNDNTVVKFGYDYQERQKIRRVFDNSNTVCGSGGAAGNIPFTCNRSQLFSENLSEAELGQLLTVFDGEAEGFLSGTSSNLPRNFVTPNIDIVRQAFENFGARFGGVSPLTQLFNPNLSSDIEEDTIGAYIQADWDGQIGSTPFRASLGTRLSYTDLTSTGVGTVLESIAIDNVSGNNQITTNANSIRVEENDYFEFLPSFNISLDLTEELILRGGLSRTLSRPTFNDLSTVFAVTSINAGTEAISASDPQLEAVTSNNLDVSLEYYGENGLTLSAAVFYKDIQDFITNANVNQAITIDNAFDAATGAALPPQTVNFLVSGPQNGDEAELYGLELGGQKLWNNGWGVSANVTFAESDATSGGVDSQLENISDTTLNLSAFYESERFSGRISLNNRSEFLSSTENEGGIPEFTDDFTQVDISLSYNFTDNLTAFLDGINITDEAVFEFAQTPDFLELFEENGARFVFGVRGAF